MEYVTVWLIGAFISWVLLLAAMFISSRIADIEFPPLGTFLWKSAVVVASANAVSGAVGTWNGLVGMIAGFIVFFGLVARMFDLDLLQCIVIVVVIWVVKSLLLLWLLHVFVTILQSSPSDGGTAGVASEKGAGALALWSIG